MNVIVLGGTGFLGPRVVHELLMAGHRVAVFHRGQTPGDLPPEVPHIQGDRNELRRKRRALLRFEPDVVVDLIALTERHATELLAVFEGRIQYAVVASSIDVYRAWARFRGLEPGRPDPVPLTEDSPLCEYRFPRRSLARDRNDVLWDYDKIDVEMTLASSDLPTTLLRLPFVWGPGDPRQRWEAFAEPMRAGARTVGLSHRRSRWKSTRAHVSEVARKIAYAVDPYTPSGVFNVGSEPPWTELEGMQSVADALGWAGRIKQTGALPDDPANWAQDLVLAVAPEWRCERRVVRPVDLLGPA